MSTKFVTNLNLNQNQILNGRFEVVATDPNSDNFEGRLIYNSTEDTIKVWSGSAWRKMLHGVSAAGSSSVAITVSESNGAITITPNLATSSTDGVMSASDKAKLDNATSEATASTLVIRDINGQAKFGTPTDASHAATKGYVDAARSGLDVKQSVRAATTGPVNLANQLEAGDTIDTTVTLVAGDRVLVKNQSTASENGIYVVQASGAAVRASDANGTADTGEVSGGTFTFVEEGTVNADSGWVVSSNGPLTVGTDAINWVQFSGAGQITAGAGLTKTGNTIDAVGTDNRITVNADSIDIASTYVGQSSITTLGTITTGTWDANTVAVTAGGTGNESFTDNGVIYGNGSGALDVTAAGTQYQVLRAGSGGVPEFGAVNLSSSVAVTSQLPIANGGTSASTEAGARTNLAAGGVQGSGVSTPSLTRKVTKTVGNGVDTSFTVVHAFNTREVMIQVYDASSYDTVIADTVRTDADTVTVSFSAAPSSNAFTVVVIG
jgi:hypothetical protein